MSHLLTPTIINENTKLSKFCSLPEGLECYFYIENKNGYFLSIPIHTYRRRGFKRCYTRCIVALYLQNVPVKIVLLKNMEKKNISVQNLLLENYESKEYGNTRWAAMRPVRSTSYFIGIPKIQVGYL